MATAASDDRRAIESAAMLALPSFLQQLLSPDVKSVLFYGCGGGFDFVHTMLLYPILKAARKEVIIVSNSFLNPHHYPKSPGSDVFKDPLVRRVTGSMTQNGSYEPEVHICSFLDAEFPDDAPHFVYACNARSDTGTVNWTIKRMTQFLQQIVDKHDIDAAVTIDGGSDGLMRGDEAGLADCIEDATSLGACAALNVRSGVRLLISAGFGTDRWNGISDASSLRAVAELTNAGGFRGSFSLEPSGPPARFYHRCLQHIYARQSTRLLVSYGIMNAVHGAYGVAQHPDLKDLEDPSREWSGFTWPLAAILWAFDATVAAQRSMLCTWLADVETTVGLTPYDSKFLEQKRRDLTAQGLKLKPEELPTFEAFARARSFDTDGTSYPRSLQSCKPPPRPELKPQIPPRGDGSAAALPDLT